MMKATCSSSISPCRHQLRRAFSLIEIMVSVALLGVIIVGLLAMFYQVQRAFRAGTAQVDVMEGGRATMNLLVRDLQEMTASNLEFVTNCVVTSASGAAEQVQDIPTGSQRTNYFHDISFISRVSRVDEEWVGTSYRISNAVNGVGVLYRFVTNRARETLPLVSSNSISTLSDEVSFLSALNNPSYSPKFSRVLDGVVGLKITPVDTNGMVFMNNDPTQIPNATGPAGYTNANVHVINPDFFGFRSNTLPAYVDIEIAILEPSTLAKFRAREEAGQLQALEYLQRQAGRTHVFRQRVAIRPATAQLRSLTFN